MSYLNFNNPKIKREIQIPVNKEYNALLINQFTNYGKKDEVAMNNKRNEELHKLINELARIISECTEKTQNT